MRPDRARLLAALLQEMRTEDGDRFPDEAWGEIQRTFALPYVEVVVTRRGALHDEVLLTRREADDPDWPGRPWHIPGGMWRTGRTLDEACRDVARREIRVHVSACHEVMSHKWSDHPYGHPISHVCLCVTDAEPEETDSARFFPLREKPSPFLAQHGPFLDAVAQHLALCQDPTRRHRP